MCVLFRIGSREGSVFVRREVKKIEELDRTVVECVLVRQKTG